VTKLREIYNQKRKGWWLQVDFEEAKKQQDLNIKTIEAVMKWRENPERPISILLVHSSGRHPTMSCAKEMSNSQMLLEKGMELAEAEFEGDLDVNRLILREMYMEPCNNCISTASSLCGFPCDCYPGDDITVKCYPMLLWADVILFSTGVNQSMVSSRLKILLDRMISLDGGYYRRGEDLAPKNAEFREQMIRLSQEAPVYDQRLFGRVAGYVVASKDHHNTHREVVDTGEFTYEQLMMGSLKHSNGDYGFFHADKWYVMCGSNPDEEYSFDKAYFQEDPNKEHYWDQIKDMVLASIGMAQKFRTDPPEFKGGARINRT
jgi:multimeric flavodoxin WrbA